MLSQASSQVRENRSLAIMVCIAQLSPGSRPILEIHLSNRSGSSKGIQQCGKSKPCFISSQSAVCFWPAQQLFWPPWPWCRRRARRLPSASIRRSVPMATMTIHHMAARLLVIMGRATSIMGSSSAWAHGQAGAMDTAGAIIASTVLEADATSLAIETAAFMGRIMDTHDQ